MKLYCPRCGAPITSDCMNLHNLAACCSACHELFAFSGKIEPDRTRSCDPSLIVPEYRPKLSRPPRMRAKESEGILTIYWPWRDVYLTPLAILCISWNGILIVGCATAFTNHPPPLVFLPAFVLGAYLAYALISGFTNFSYIRATANYLEVNHAPLPWPNREILRHRIVRIYYSRTFSFNGALHERFDLYVILIDDRRIKLVGGLDLPEVHFVQRKLEDRLQLPHDHHPSEFYDA